MADALVQRLTGQADAAAVPVEIELVMTDRTLLGTGVGQDEPGEPIGYGPLPASWARRLALADDLVAGSHDHTTGSRDRAAGGDRTDRADRADRAHVADHAGQRWIRRLYTETATGGLIAADSRRRCFTPAQRRFVRWRDRTCRTPWCDAPVRHVDHVDPAGRGGPTSLANAQGLCEACNYTRQLAGWTTAVPDLPRRAGGELVEVVVVTRTGHRYRSRPPDPPRTGPPDRSPVELELRRHLRRRPA